MKPSDFIDRYVAPSVKQHCLFHFTDGKNVPLIKRHGLLSTRRLTEMGIKPTYGGNDISLTADKKFGMDGYVHLCFMRNNSMEFLARNQGRIKDVKYLEISPAVLHLPGVLITDGVSNAREVNRYSVEEGLDHLDAEVIYNRTPSSPENVARWKKAHKCEILVPDHIPIEYIENL